MIVPLNEIETLKHKRILIHGQPGSGKTLFSCISQKHRIGIIDIDRGLTTVQSWIAKHPEKKYLSPVVSQPKTIAEFEKDYTAMLKNPDIDIVVIDTLSEYQRFFIAEKTGTKNYTDQRDWGDLLVDLEDICKEAERSNKHCIFTCHTGKSFDPVSDTEVLSATFQGRFGEFYTRHFDLIGFLSWSVKTKLVGGQKTNEVERKIIFSPSPNVRTKDRTNKLTTEEPNLDTILAKILGE